MKTKIAMGLAVAALCATAGQAQAQYPAQGAPPPPMVVPVETVGYGATVGLRLGYGFDLEDGDFNPYGLGFGLNLQFAPDQSVFFGGLDFIYHLGESFDIGTTSYRANVMQAMFWGGYNGVVADRLVIRPALGIGIETFKFYGESDTGIAVGAQFEVMYFVTEQIHVDLLGRYTGGWHGGSESLDGVSFLVGAGYAF